MKNERLARNNRLHRERHHDKYYQDQKDRRSTVLGKLKQCLSSAKTRSKQKGLELKISIDDLVDLYYIQNGKCAVTGIQMQSESGTRDHINMFCISIDRINTAFGYTKSNIQLVCWAVNQIKWYYSKDELVFWLEAILKGLTGQSAAKPLIEEGSTTISKESRVIRLEAQSPNKIG